MKRKEKEPERKQVTDWDEMYPGRFLKAGDFKGKTVTLKVSRVYAEKMPDQNGKERFKGILGFEKTELELALNKTNGLCIKAMFGREVQAWIGKRVTFFPTPYDGDLAIRVHGSPDIERDIEITIAHPRKKPFDMTLHRVVSKVAKTPPAPAAAPAPEAELEEGELEESDPLTGEVPFSEEEKADILAQEEAVGT